MDDAVRMSLMMDSQIIGKLDEMSNKTKVTRSRLIRIACNILISLIKDEYINENALKQANRLMKDKYEVDYKGKIALRQKARDDVREALTYDLYKIYTNGLMRESVDNIEDSGLLYYYKIGDFFIKSDIPGIDEFDEEGIKILSEIVKKEKLKKRKK